MSEEPECCAVPLHREDEEGPPATGPSEAMSKHRIYLVYDGRFSYDPDRATVLEVLGEIPSLKSAMRQARDMWGQQGAVLVSYEDDGGNLTNEQVHGEVP